MNIDPNNNLRISHSSIVDFNNCLRLYYFKNIYKNPKTGNRVQIVNPYLSLGSAVHNTIDEVVDLSPSKRLKTSLIKKFDKVWDGYSGRCGGFISKKQEDEFKKRGYLMIKKVEKSELFKKKSFKKGANLMKINLIDDIDLVGALDWIEILPDKTFHIIDFKTGRSVESKKSLQLPIYQLLAQNNYNQKVKKLSYWYLDRDNGPKFKKIDSTKSSEELIKQKALEIKDKINSSNFSCSSKYHKCFWCRTYEGVISGQAEYIGVDEEMKKDLYFLVDAKDVIKKINQEEFLNENEKTILEMRLDKKSISQIQEEVNLSKKKLELSVEEIKQKIKNNLTQKELRVFINRLGQN